MPTADDAELPPGLALAWRHPDTSNKLGRKPSRSVEEVVEAALELADADGFTAISMPKIAQRIGLTTNAIYRYVSSRDELLVLVAEAAWGPAPDLVSDPQDWRAAATVWTRAMIDRCDVHPWLCDLPIRGAPVTPHLLGWTEAILKVLTGAGLSPSESLGCALLLDGYARQIANARRDVRESTSASVQSAAVTRFLEPRLREQGYSILASMMAGNEYSDDILDDDITFGLERILDGTAALITRKELAEERDSDASSADPPDQRTTPASAGTHRLARPR
ncbi:putative transcriptional regulator, TetR family [Nocardia nova SH22a]|uniref:Putative transcriptional regulator, TetR family n=1 Tax=Nocardia nova SH22a TaxID=1415166 RepID=W5TTI1_9NOCA|nr:TetR/AcrR family transcriptional regulator [Nocardia nova]AHH22238.1 putative transcriptional regulator, TetR family [Nocardia nova SH22a]